MEGQAPATDAGTPQVPVLETPAQAEVRRHKVKVNGQDREVDESDLLRGYELREASHQRMQKAAELEKQYKEKEAKYKKDPWSYLQEMGLDPDKAAEERLLKKLEYELMSPEAKNFHAQKQKLEADRAEVSQLMAAKEDWEREVAKKHSDELTSKAIQSIDQDIGQVLQATGLKPTRRVIARVAEVMLSHLDASEDGELLDAKSAFGRVDEEMSQEIGDFLQAMPIEKAVEKLPKPFLDALRKFFLKQVQDQDPVMRGRETRTPQSQGPATRRRVTSTDNFFDRLEKKLK